MLQCAYKSLRISTLRLKDSEIAAGDVVALCAMQEYISLVIISEIADCQFALYLLNSRYIQMNGIH